MYFNFICVMLNCLCNFFSPKPQDKEDLGKAIIEAFPKLRCSSGSGYVSWSLQNGCYCLVVHHYLSNVQLGCAWMSVCFTDFDYRTSAYPKFSHSKFLIFGQYWTLSILNFRRCFFEIYRVTDSELLYFWCVLFLFVGKKFTTGGWTNCRWYILCHPQTE